MKRLAKVVLNLLMALIAVCLTLGILFFMNPAWQKSAVEEVFKRDASRQWQIGAVKVQPLGLEAQSIFVLDGPVGAEVNFLQLNGPMWKVPLTGVVEIHSGEISGFSADLSSITVGDPTSEDYRLFLERVSGDSSLWEERLALLLGKFSMSGLKVRIRDLQLQGKVLMPGGKVVPVRWMVEEADSDAPRLIRIKPFAEL